jgi:hypothetical protein
MHGDGLDALVAAALLSPSVPRVLHIGIQQMLFSIRVLDWS